MAGPQQPAKQGDQLLLVCLSKRRGLVVTSAARSREPTLAGPCLPELLLLFQTLLLSLSDNSELPHIVPKNSFSASVSKN